MAQAAAAYRDMWHGGDFGGGPLAIGAAWQVLDAALAAAHARIDTARAARAGLDARQG